MKSKLMVSVVALLMFASQARAEKVAVVVFGKSKARDRDVVASAIVESLKANAWSLVDAPLSPKEQDTIISCSTLDRPWSCLAPTARERGFDRVAVVQVDPAKGNKDLVLTGQIIVQGDGVPSTEQGECKSCTSEPVLVAAASELAAKMIEQAKARNTNATLSIKTRPTGATITLDGQMIAGATDRTIMVPPGEHTVLLQRSGFQPETRTVTAVEAKVESIEINLVSTDQGSAGGNEGPDQGDHETHQRSRAVPIVLMTVGALAIVGGGVALALDKEDDGGKPANEEQPRYYYDTTIPGVVAIAGGAAVGVLGYVLFRRAANHDATVTAAPTPGGFAVGFHSSF